MDSTLKYAEHKLDEAIKQGETDVDISYWRGYRDCAKAMERKRIDREAWKPCRACKDGEITVHVPEFRAMAVCNQNMDHAAFDLTLRLKFCPWCGRPMTKEAWAELEKRLMG